MEKLINLHKEVRIQIDEAISKKQDAAASDLSIASIYIQNAILKISKEGKPGIQGPTKFI